MGMYTELNLNVCLGAGTPYDVINILEYMVGDGPKILNLPAHPLFSTERWDWMLTCDSYYFPAVSSSTLNFDEIGKYWQLSARSNFKNYNGEIGLFLDWIAPHLDDDMHNNTWGDFLGYWRYEEDREPTIIYLSEVRSPR